MTEAPLLFDRALIEARRDRARSIGIESFLHDAARAELEERLTTVNRSFTDIAVVSGFPELWRSGRLSGARQVADTDTLDLLPESLDLVVHAMALHQANDPVGQLIQCRRALRPDGLFLAAMLGGRTLQEMRAAFAEAEIALRGGLSPRIAPMADIRDLGGLLQRAGFALPVADILPLPVDYSDPLRLFRDLRAMGEGNALVRRDTRPVTRGLIAEVLRRYTAFATPEGRFRASFEIVVLTGWAPGPGQQQPLRPGSALQRLADALGTREHPAGDTPPR